jgi:hypothetical protein
MNPLDAIVAELVPVAAPPTLEDVLTSPEWFGLVTATPLQRAICRIAEGLPIDDLLGLPLVPNLHEYPAEVQERCTWQWCLGDVASLPSRPPKEVYVVAGIRGGKSLLAAAAATHAGITADLTGLRRGEAPRFPIVSTSKDIARAVYDHMTGAAKISSRVAGLLASHPTTERVELRHPRGDVCEVRIAAGSRAGSSLVSRWLLGVVFDEAPRMLPGEEGVVNFDDQRQAVLGRIRPGGTLWAIGSPWAPLGPIHKAVEESWQRPTAELVVIRAPGPALNPGWWTPGRCEDMRRTSLEAFLTDVLGEFADLESSALTDAELRAATRHELTRPPEEGVTYYAEMDPATRGNGWAWVIGGQLHDGKLSIVRCGEINRPDGGAVSPAQALRELAGELAEYGVSEVGTDQWSADAIVDLAAPLGLVVVPVNVTAKSKANDLDGARALIREGRVELPPDRALQGDLRRVRRRLTADGGVRVVYPQTADGRHCDFAGPVLKLLARPDLAPAVKVTADIPEGWTEKEWEDVQKVSREIEDETSGRDWSPGLSAGGSLRRAGRCLSS